MTVDQLLQTVESSAASDWHPLDVQTISGWEWGEKNGQNYLEPKMHSKLFIFKPDVDIALAMDATVNDPFAEPWVQVFPDKHAVSVAVHLRFRGALVYQWVSVVVDGGRYILPMPELSAGGGYELRQSLLPLAQLFFQLYGADGPYQNVESALRRAGITVV